MVITVLCMVGTVVMGFIVLVAMAVQTTAQHKPCEAPMPYYTYKNGVYT
jgi:hypothetical protein